MKDGFGIIRLSASDLSNYLTCHHLTSPYLSVSVGAGLAPGWHSPDARCLAEVDQTYWGEAESGGATGRLICGKASFIPIGARLLR